MLSRFENKEYHGKIQLSKSEVILIPDDFLLIVPSSFPDNEYGWNKLHGEFEGLGNVTLFGCFPSYYETDNGESIRAIRFVKLFADEHVSGEADAFISSATFVSSALNKWICAAESIMSTTTATKLTELFRVNLKELTLTVRYDSMLSDPKIRVEMLFPVAINSQQLFGLYRKLQNLILFITNEDPDVAAINYNGSKLLRLQSYDRFDRDLFSDSIEFSYEQLRKHLNIIFKCWFGETKLDAIRNLLLEKKYNPQLSQERYFMNMCVILESFHQRFITNKVKLVDDTPIKNRKQIALHLQNDPELQKWFLEKSAFWKLPTLYDRLIALKDIYAEIIRDLFGIPVEELIQKVKNCRNRLAHDGEYEKVFREEQELFLVGYSLEMLMSVLLYEKHGVDGKSLRKELKTRAHRNLKRLCWLNNIELVRY